MVMETMLSTIDNEFMALERDVYKRQVYTRKKITIKTEDTKSSTLDLSSNRFSKYAGSVSELFATMV